MSIWHFSRVVVEINMDEAQREREEIAIFVELEYENLPFTYTH